MTKTIVSSCILCLVIFCCGCDSSHGIRLDKTIHEVKSDEFVKVTLDMVPYKDKLPAENNIRIADAQITIENISDKDVLLFENIVQPSIICEKNDIALCFCGYAGKRNGVNYIFNCSNANNSIITLAPGRKFAWTFDVRYPSSVTGYGMTFHRNEYSEYSTQGVYFDWKSLSVEVAYIPFSKLGNPKYYLESTRESNEGMYLYSDRISLEEVLYDIVKMQNHIVFNLPCQLFDKH